jgi:hypothetical protein
MTVAEATRPEAIEQPNKVKQSTFQLSEHAYGRRSVTLPVGWTLDEILAPEAWSEVAHLLEGNKLNGIPPQAGSIIEVRTQDHAFYAELYVRAVRKMALDVDVIQAKTLGPKDEKPISGNYRPRWNVGAGGYDILRSDGAIVGRASDFKLKEDANAYIRDVLKG